MLQQFRAFNKMEAKSESKSKEVLSMDELLERVGPFGAYQIRTQAVFFLFMLPLTYQVLIMYFAAADPPWYCKEGSKSCHHRGLIYSNMAKKFQFRCKINRSEWDYSTSKQFSIITEFDLICGREVLAYTANSILFVGWTIGGIVLPYLSDHLGRKTILYPSALGIMMCGVFSSVAHRMWLLIVCRLCIGFFQAGVVNVFVLATEMVGQSYRSLSGTFIWLYFTIALLVMTLKAYYLQNWRNLELFCSLPFLVLLLTWRLVPESVRWLRMKGRQNDAMNTLHEMAILNKRALKNEELIPVQNQPNYKSSIADLFRPLPIALYTLVQSAAWFICGMTFYGISLASNDLGGDFYGDFALTSIVEFPANVLVVILTNRFGRRSTTIFNIFLAGLSCGGISIVPSNSTNKAYKYARIGLGMLGKFAVTIYFNAFYIWSAELNATVVRVQAIGLLIAISRIGAAFSPFIVTGLKYVHESLPFILLAVLNSLAGLFCFHLRETINTPSPDTTDDCIALLKKQNVNQPKYIKIEKEEKE